VKIKTNEESVKGLNKPFKEVLFNYCCFFCIPISIEKFQVIRLYAAIGKAVLRKEIKYVNTLEMAAMATEFALVQSGTPWLNDDGETLLYLGNSQ
jgi:hypothetical protein